MLLGATALYHLDSVMPERGQSAGRLKTCEFFDKIPSNAAILAELPG
jgi:hypothetical protein